jgi:K+-sensing histidine kinase KdpD
MFERDSTPGVTIREPSAPAAEGGMEAAAPREGSVKQLRYNRIIRGWFPRGAAVAAEVVVAYLLRELVAHRHPGFAPFITFYPAILLSSVLDGMWAGIAVTGLATLIAQIWIFAPYGRMAVSDPYDMLSLAIFFAFGVSLSIVV